MQRIDDLDVAGQVVLLRADLNVPLDGDVITDDGRIRASLPTIKTLAGRGARVLICAHLGQPQGDGYAARAAGGPSCGRSPPASASCSASPSRWPGTWPGIGRGPGGRAGRRGGRPAGERPVRADETSKIDAERTGLAARLAALATCYVGDGFGALHRKHASVYDVPALLPHAAGELVIAEIAVLRQLTSDPPRPYVVVLGGAKPSDKLAVIGNLLSRADRLIICGGMSYTFLAAQGYEVGKSLLEADQIPQVTEVLAEAARRGVEVVLPVDLVAADRFAPDADHRVVPVSDFPADRESLDMGPETRALFAQKLSDAKTVFWNGPAGVFEFPAFAAGTLALAEAISRVSGLTVVGGGDSAAAVRQLGFPADAFTHISTGGGASLEYLEGRPLPRAQRTRGGRMTGTPMARKPLIAGNWKMHNTHFEGLALVQKLAFTLTGAITTPPTWWSCRRSPRCAACRRWWPGTSCGSATGPRTCHHTTRAPTPGTCPGRCWPSWAAATCWPATPSAVNSTPRTTRWSTPR